MNKTDGMQLHSKNNHYMRAFKMKSTAISTQFSVN